jgi:hypothetical protein
MLFSDGLLDISTAFLYEKINFIMLRNATNFNQKRINSIMHTEVEIGLLYENKIIVEAPVMEINRLYLNTQKLLKCKEGIQVAKSLFGTRQKDHALLDVLKAKAKPRSLFYEKFKENIKQIRGELEGQEINKFRTFLIEK